ADVIMIYLVGVVVIATRFDITVSVFAAVAAVLTFDFVFVPPEFTLSLPDVRSAITCAGMLGVAVVISALTTRARRFEASSRLREARTALLYELSRELVEAANFEEVVAVAVRHLEALLGRRVAVLAPGSDGTFAAVDAFGPIWLTQAELGRAADVFRAGVERGASSSGEHARGDTRELGTYFSLLTGSGSPFGLVAVRGARNLFADATEREFFEACAHQAALALERADLAQKAAAAERAAEREQVRNALLRSISHDFRTPLAAILGAGLSLKDYGSALEPAARSMLEGTIVEQGQRLHRLLTNVLSATRLDGGELELEKSPCSIDEIVESALRHLGEAVGRRHVDVSLPFELPLVDADAVLLEQLVVNVVENALRYAGAETPIEIAARARDGNVELTIADHGRGVAPGDEARLFEKFYRGASSKPNDGGMGLGLTICRAVAEAHGGSIVAANREGGGFCVTTTLPCAFAGSCDAAFELSLPEGVA
ncbi:MAG TPA: ATP-binding protein, partial [Polyangiaceae bacterium]|nr:ATP-binding protein [Polyangiaceae bacterium]